MMTHYVTPALLRSWGACYTDEQIAEVFAGRNRMSPRTVARLDVPAEDRAWALIQWVHHIGGDRAARLLACDYAESVLPVYESQHPGDARPRTAIAVARRFARGEATSDDLAAARDAAWAAAMAASCAASGCAALAAAWAASWAASCDAAMDTHLHHAIACIEALLRGEDPWSDGALLGQLTAAMPAARRAA